MATITRQSKYLYDSTGNSVLLPKVIIQDLMYPKDPSSFDPDDASVTTKGAEAVASCLEGQVLKAAGLNLKTNGGKVEAILTNDGLSLINNDASGNITLKTTNVKIGEGVSGNLNVEGQMTGKILTVTGDTTNPSTINGKLVIVSDTSSSSKETGALVISKKTTTGKPGLGVEGNINSGGDINAAGKVKGNKLEAIAGLTVNAGGMSVTGSSEFKGNITASGYTIYAKTLEVSENVNVQNDVNARGFLRTWKDVYVGCDNSGNSDNRISTNNNMLQLLSRANEVMIYSGSKFGKDMWINFRAAPSGYNVPDKFVFAKGEGAKSTTNRSDIACGALECTKEAKAKVHGVSDIELGLPVGSITMWGGHLGYNGWVEAEEFGVVTTPFGTYNDSTNCASAWLSLNGGEFKLQAVTPKAARNGDNIYKHVNDTDYVWIPQCVRSSSYSSGSEENFSYWIKASLVQFRHGAGGFTNFTVSSEKENITRLLNRIIHTCRFRSDGGSTVYSIFNVASLYLTSGTYFRIGLPNMRGRMPMGSNETEAGIGKTDYHQNLGSLGGESTHKLTNSEIQHTHAESSRGSCDPGKSWDNVDNGSVNMNNNDAHNNMPPYLPLNFIVKYK